MPMTDSNRLYDIATRIAVYTEKVKINQAREFASVIRDVSDELVKLFGRVKYGTLDGMTKKELNALLASLRGVQYRVYTSYTEKLIANLRRFMSASAIVNRRALATAIIETDDDAIDALSDDEAINLIDAMNEDGHGNAIGIMFAISDEKLWGRIEKEVIPANGVFIIPMVKAFSVASQATVENAVRKAWANGLTTEEAIAEIVGDGLATKQGVSSVLSRIAAQSAAVTHTAMAHVAQMTSEAVSASMFRKYIWHSVIDNRTTDICRGRNQKIFTYGKGPIPPAHIRCRSHISPIGDSNPNDDESFGGWVARQPKDFVDDVFGKGAFSSISKSSHPEKEVAKFNMNSPSTIDEFLSKIDLVTKRATV